MSKTTTTTQEDEVRVSKIRPDENRSGLHVRITEQHHEKLTMLVRETGRSRRDIVEMLIDMSKVGEYTQ
jgi:hypothetical protein